MLFLLLPSSSRKNDAIVSIQSIHGENDVAMAIVFGAADVCNGGRNNVRGRHGM